MNSADYKNIEIDTYDLLTCLWLDAHLTFKSTGGLVVLVDFLHGVELTTLYRH